MTRKGYCLATAALFSIICLLQLARIVFAWEAIIGGWSVPIWISWLAVAITATIAYFGYRHGSKES